MTDSEVAADMDRRFVLLFSNYGYAPFVAMGELLGYGPPGQVRVRLLMSWNLKGLIGVPALREDGSHRSMYFESYNRETWEDAEKPTVLVCMEPGLGGPRQVLVKDEALAKDIIYEAMTGIQLSLDGSMTRAGLSDEQKAAVLRVTT